VAKKIPIKERATNIYKSTPIRLPTMVYFLIFRKNIIKKKKKKRLSPLSFPLPASEDGSAGNDFPTPQPDD
jgi:hypothetical protein